jgi:hypothetical protein
MKKKFLIDSVRCIRRHSRQRTVIPEWYLNTMWKIFGQMKYQKGREKKWSMQEIIIIENWKWISLSLALALRRWTLTRYFSGRREWRASWKLHSCVRGMPLTKKNETSLKGEENWENTKIENQEFLGVVSVVMAKGKNLI